MDDQQYDNIKVALSSLSHYNEKSKQFRIGVLKGD